MSEPDTTEETAADTPEISHQPQLDGLELPEYHGRKPVGMKTALTGAGTRIARAHGIGDRVVLVIEAKVKKAAHEETDDGLVYSETLKVVDLFEIDRDPGSRLLSAVRSAYRTAEDAVKAREPLRGADGTPEADMGEVGYTDASGIVLTPAEIAAIRGEPARALLTEQLTPAVIVYDNRERALWPDDFPKDTPRPALGQAFGELVVAELLHHETGEVIASLDVDRVEIIDDDDPVLDEAPDDEGDPFPADASLDDGTSLDDDADDWEEPTPPRPLLPGEGDELPDNVTPLRPSEPTEPNLDDHAYKMVDRGVAELREMISGVADEILLRRYLAAEHAGRGRGLRVRRGAVEAIEARIAEVVAARGGE